MSTVITDQSTIPMAVGISFSSSDPTVLTVTQDPNDQTKATVTALKVGNAVVTVAYAITVG